MRWIPGPVEQTATAPPVRRQRGVAVLAAILSAACWGSATVMSKGVLEHMPPMTLLAVQLTASITVLWLAVLVLRSRVRFDCSTRRASLSGLLEPGLAYTLGIIGLALTTASSAALIGAAEPLFILLLAWLILTDRRADPSAGRHRDTWPCARGGARRNWSDQARFAGRRYADPSGNLFRRHLCHCDAPAGQHDRTLAVVRFAT